LTISLDTNALVEIINGDRPSVRLAFRAAVDQAEDMVVSVLVAHELRFEAQMSRRRSETDAVEELLAMFPIIPFTEEDSSGATAVRVALERIGRRIGAMDTLIAGHAVNRGWSIVTANVNEFDHVAGLTVIDWTAAPETP